MPETLFEEMKRYVRFTDEDSKRLASFAAVAAPHFRRIADEFYDRAREHEEAHAVFTGEEQITRLKQSLVRWLERLCAGPHDEDYFQEQVRIGQVHVRIGLPQRYMFTGMSLIRTSLERIADTLPNGQGPLVRQSLARILDIQLAIMAESYRDDFVARLQRLEQMEKDRLERALARSEHRYVNAVELAKVLVVGMDAQTRIWLFNREAERTTGLARDEVLGRRFADVLLPEDIRDEEASRIERAASGTQPPDEVWEAPIVTRSGKRRMVHWQLSYVPDAKDEDVVLFAIGQDVTEANALLERTMRSEKLAAIGTLAAGLAHEIRNPLNGALLHVTFLERALKRSGADEDTLSAVKFVADEIRRLSALVRDFLVFARPTPPQFKPTSLRELCQRAVDVVATDAAAAHATVTTDHSSVDIVVDLDAQKMEQVLLNLLRNAIEAVGSTGGGNVILRTRRTPRHAIIEVEDEGPGLPSPDAPIFDAFYSTKPNGTGLGLAIVHRVVTDHEGTVEVESKPGRTVFRVLLPIASKLSAEKS